MLMSARLPSFAMVAAFTSTGAPAGIAPFTLTADRWSPADLPVVSIRGTEQISRLYRFEILLARVEHAPATLERDLLGQPARLALLSGPGEGRTVHGIVRRIEAEGALGDQGGRHGYRLWLAPRLWLAGRGKNSRIFQDLTVPGIVDRILDDWGLPRRWHLAQEHAPRAYCVQYQESDLDFLQRILADEGIFFHFEHPDDAGEGEREVIVFADDPHLVKPIDGEPALEVREGDGLSTREGDVRRFRVRQEVRPGAVLLKDFDFVRPAFDLRAEARVAAKEDAFDPAQVRVYDHRGERERSRLDNAVARLHLEQHRTAASVGEGESRCRRILPGRWFELRGCPADGHDGRYTIFRVDHEGCVPERQSGEDEARETYRNTFRCVPLETAFRPRRPRRELRQVVETATVVGPAGQEIHTDELGRIKVHFHWDREGENSPSSSCWIRVAQAWAGAGWGFQFIPRVGMEVLVTFVGGDVDRPMVTGCVYNAQHPHPFALPASKTKSGIVTQTTRGGGGHNELSFEDRRDYERIFLHAQRDLDFIVRSNQTTRVDANQTDVVAGNCYEIVGQSRISNVSGDVVLAVEGAEKTTVHGDSTRMVRGSSSDTVSGDAVHHIDGSRRVFVSKAHAVSIGGSAREHVSGDRSTHVQGADDLVISGNAITTVRGTAAFNVQKDVLVVVGSEAAPARASTRLAGDLEVISSGAAEIDAADEIRLTVGDSALEIRSDSVRIVSKSIILAADAIQVTSSKASLMMGDGVDLYGEVVKVSSEANAVLNLGQEAKLDGAMVKLNSGVGAERAKREQRSREAPNLPKERVRLFDQQGEIILNARYEVSLPGYFDCGTAPSGEVEIPKFPDVEVCRLRWGRPISAREEGALDSELEFETDLYLNDEHPDAAESLRRKLHNLGIVADDPTDAAYAFQAARGAPRTGLTDDVRDDVDRQHGSARAIQGRPGSSRS
ncbi:type VI secretion system tip protein TssI/VgrG [Sorangium sp. So ce367]|uniref:type VI secretion system Vgr family protein n=1 Tax=Sorangium sp. So ce367 TaxID=3133305 RepID=UPI003F63A59E